MSPASRNPELANKIAQMRLTIAPIIHIETGVPPPQFPSTMLELFLLTEDELDAMAHYYSQVVPVQATYAYPQTMDWNRSILARPTSGEDLPDDCRLTDLERVKVKMRMFARFIGMRGAETPRWEHEKQIELLKARIEHTIKQEELAMVRKFYRGPPAFP